MAAARHSIRILLVDGDFTVQHLRALMLRMRGYHVDTAASLDAAREELSQRDYSLLIVDVGHYAEAGLQFCEEIKRTKPHQKLLLQAEDRAFPLKNDCPDGVIPKQEGPHTFVKAVERVLQAA